MSVDHQTPSTKDTACEAWDDLFLDAVDGILPEEQRAALDRHMATCVPCSEEFAAAQRGAAWLGMLKPYPPAPDAALLERVLAATTGSPAEAYSAVATEAAPVIAPKPSAWNAISARMREWFHVDGLAANFQPRMAMTAAMAFFSIALTLNLMGVRLADLEGFRLRPGGIERTVADASAAFSRRVQNQRVVYQLESRVGDLRRDALPDDDLRQNDTSSSTRSDAKPAPHAGRPSS